ncbi:MAG: TetR family transcriptional regulator [Planctomycetes bacterium]|nr:TetR family transcriptional regulator [Planctomycetota bacterium]
MCPPSASSTDTTPTKAWLRAGPEQRREMIVGAAMKLLHRKGPAAVTMRRVAASLGVGTMTLYTYLEGQTALHREMVRRGFEMLNAGCREHSTVDQDGSWRGGARYYLQFAIDHPNLFRLMFDTPLPEGEEDLLRGGFQPLLERVMERLRKQKQLSGQALEREARKQAGRYWLGVHGLAMVAISNRLSVLEGDLDELLDDLLPRIAPQ